MKITKVKLCDEDACYCMGSIECKEEETFQEKLERALQRSIRKHGVKSFEPAPSESNDA